MPNIDTWENELRAELGVPPAGTDAPGLLCRVLYKPSFHAECCVSIFRQVSGGATLSFTSCGTSLWYWRSYEEARAHGQWHAGEPGLRRPRAIKADVEAVPERMHTFLASVPSSFPTLDAGSAAMIDGMAVILEWFPEGRKAVVAEANEFSDPATFQVAVAVLALARDTFSQEDVRAVLQDVVDYVSPGTYPRTAEDERADLALLEYDPLWVSSGFLPPASLAKQARKFRFGPDRNTEQYRYAAFCAVLDGRERLTDAEIDTFVALVLRDPDMVMARGALINLLRWDGLTPEQFAALRARPECAEPVFVHAAERRELNDQLLTNGPSDGLLARALDGGETWLQRALADHPDATPGQLRRLAERGGSRAIRNVAAGRLKARAG